MIGSGNWRRLTDTDLPQLQAFCRENKEYYSYIRCVPTLESLQAQLAMLPPGARPEQKQFLGLWKNGELAAILDLIQDWLRQGVAYIGWFMVAKPLQRTGLGRRLEAQLARRMKTKGYHTLRLACVEDNLPGLDFWYSCGFAPAGQRAEQDDYAALLLEKGLSDEVP